MTSAEAPFVELLWDSWRQHFFASVVSGLPALLVGALLCAAVYAIVARAPKDRERRLVKANLILAAVLFGLGMVSLSSGLILTAGSVAAPGLSQSDRMRMWSNGIAEAVYALVLAVSLAAPALTLSVVMARRVKRDGVKSPVGGGG